MDKIMLEIVLAVMLPLTVGLGADWVFQAIRRVAAARRGRA